MKKALLCYAAAAFSFVQLHAQEGHQHGPWCAAVEKKNELLSQYPGMQTLEIAYEEALREASLSADRDDEVLRIPIVFHILHDQGPENISDAQVFDAFNLLNEHMRKSGIDTAFVIPSYQDIHADTRIEFVMANKAPDGSCTNGINRVRSSLAFEAGDFSKTLAQWPRHIYFNVWVVGNIASAPGRRTLGYATFPFMVEDFTQAFRDGVVMAHDVMGTIGTATNPFLASTLAHEVGHWLNLRHTWGDFGPVGTVCGDDGVEDTPETRGFDNFCPSLAQADFCNEGVIENFNNFMDYSLCAHMFTEDQATRMRTALSLPIAGRSFLTTPQGHAIAGIDQDEPTICTPRVDFFSPRYYACVGQEVNFNAYILDATAETFSWSFEDADVATSELPNPEVTFNSSGWKTVTLTAGNESGSGTRTNEFAIYIYDNDGISFGDNYTENFGLPYVPAEWTIRPAVTNALVEGVNWRWSPIGCFDEGSLQLNLFDSPSLESYRFVTPKFNLEGRAGQTVSFKYAYATQGNPEDIEISLEVRSSRNCGNSSVERLVLSDPGDIITGGAFPGESFEPNSPTFWRTASFEISAGQAFDDMQYEFILQSDFAVNNFYIDNFAIGGSVTSTADESPLTAANLYPNPATGEVNLKLQLKQSELIAVHIFDISGKQVLALQEQQVPGGSTVLPINTRGLSAGLYTVQVATGDYTKALKLVVKP